MALLAALPLAFVPAFRAEAVCLAPPEPGTAAWRRALHNSTDLIVRGTILDEVPPDARGAYTATLEVDTIYRGTSEPVVRITHWSDGDLTADAYDPGGAVERSRTFADGYAGTSAIYFAWRGSDGYDTGTCTWNRLGDGIDEMHALLIAEFPDAITGVDAPPDRDGLIAMAVALLIGVGVIAAGRARSR